MENNQQVKTYVKNAKTTVSISVKGRGGVAKLPVKKDKTDDITMLRDKRERLIEAEQKDLCIFTKTVEIVEDVPRILRILAPSKFQAVLQLNASGPMAAKLNKFKFQFQT